METSSYEDVVRFLDALERSGAPLHLGSLGVSAEGRSIPLVVASRPLVRSASEARRLNRPIAYLQGNIHGGEVEGKEALQMLLRDLLLDPAPNVLDSLVLVVVPIYNPDGNERWGPQARNRPEQRGPERVGERFNGLGLDLNRDYVKAVAPETRGALALFREWDPDLLVDLHTTNGSYHGYALTYAPSLNPAAGAAALFTRDRLLPELRRRMRARHRLETFDYGNFSLAYGSDVNTDTTREGWFSYDARPRFGTNYYGLRGKLSILSEAYSHDPFERRVRSSLAFVREVLSLVAERRAEVLAVTRQDPERIPDPLAIRSELTRTPVLGEVIAEELARADPSVPGEPGVPAGLRRTGRFRTLRLPVHDRFTPTLEVRPPAGYLLGPGETEAVRRLREHGIRVDSLSAARRVRGEQFVIDSVRVAGRPFQGHREVGLAGRWTPVDTDVPRGSWLVPTNQALGTLAVYLLEPQSDDGFAVWSAPEPGDAHARSPFAAPLQPGALFPAVRVSTIR